MKQEKTSRSVLCWALFYLTRSIRNYFHPNTAYPKNAITLGMYFPCTRPSQLLLDLPFGWGNVLQKTKKIRKNLFVYQCDSNWYYYIIKYLQVRESSVIDISNMFSIPKMRITYCFCSTGDGIQSFIHIRQMLYQCTTFPAPPPKKANFWSNLTWNQMRLEDTDIYVCM